MIRTVCLTALLALPGAAFGQASTTVLWYHGNGGTTSDSGAFNSHVGTTLFGSVAFDDDWASLDLSSYRYVLIARPTEAFQPDQIADLQDYLANGGFLVVAGDSLAAGLPQINTINDLLADLGRSARLEEEQFVNPVDIGTGLPQCTPGNVINGGNILDTASPLSLEGCGDIEPGSASIIEGYSIIVEAIPFDFDLVVVEDNVLLSADYDFFSGDDCGLIAKRSFWNNLWTVVCDLDEDGATNVACGGFDCDDTDDTIGADVAYFDADGDSYGDNDSPAPCQPASVPVGGDCDDSDPNVNPDAEEVCDGIDNDCLGGIDDDVVSGPEWYPDFDGDGFGRDGEEPIIACDQPVNHIDVLGDCDDTNDNVHEGATEVCSNGVDENCDGQVDEGCGTGVIPPTPPGGEPKCGCQSGSLAAVGLMALLPAVLTRRRARR